MLYKHHIILSFLCMINTTLVPSPTIEKDSDNEDVTILSLTENHPTDKEEEEEYDLIKITPLYEPDDQDFLEKKPIGKDIFGPEIAKMTYDLMNEDAQAFQTEWAFDQSIDNTPPLSEFEKQKWLFHSALKNAPDLLKGIVIYLNESDWDSEFNAFIPSFHRFILVGPPGSGKTTLAHAIAYELHYPLIFVPATSFLGHYRNQTSVNISQFLEQYANEEHKIVIIIDELHKLFEHHTNDQSDDSQTAAAFWLMLDKIEKYNPKAIIIGTANNVTELPAEIKSRFSGKIITLGVPNKKQRIQAFKNSIAHDPDIELHKSVDNRFITNVIEQVHNCSLRDVKLIIDAAKIFYYATRYIQDKCYDYPLVLKKIHFQKALEQLKSESKILEKGFAEKYRKQIEPWGILFSLITNIASLIKISVDLSNYDTYRYGK